MRPVKRILFIRPPAHLWPIINESDNFLMPLAFPYIAAYLRARNPELHIRVIDCLPLQIGWKTLARLIAEEKPDLVGVGEMIVYAKEGMRALALAKQIDPEVVTVAGGHFHSHMPEFTLDTYPEVDVVVRYEGEITFHELVETWNAGGDLGRVRGIVTRDGAEGYLRTPLRELADLDALPSPAYDLMPIRQYAPFGKLWPRAITIQGSRGCPYACDFCSWSAQEGDHRIDAEGRIQLVPHRRQVSVAKTIEEIDVLYHQYGIRYLFWVDATWNFDNEWLDELCTEIIRRKYKLGWWAFPRADLMLEQEKLGLLEKMVRAGLRHCLFGAERPVQEELQQVGKDNMPFDALLRMSHLLKRKYPQVFRQATFTTGIRSESAASMERLAQYSRDAKLDFAAYHPLMPYPGTALWEQASAGGWIEEPDFSNFDMFYPVMSTEHLSRKEVAHLTSKITQDFVRKQPGRYMASLFSPHGIRRRLHWWFLFSIGRVMAYDLLRSLRGEKRFEGFSGLNKLWKPDWYDT